MKNHFVARAGLLSLLLLFSFSLYRCTTEKTTSQTKATVKEPFATLKIEAKTYTVNAEKGGEIILENGTKIIVPANAFVDAEGKPVTGDVAIKYREFHNATDIILSGIPMKMTDGGQEYDFESAGMFELNGYSGTNEVAIAEGKDLVVQMASYKKEENYNHYYFDEEKGEWQELAAAVKPEPNTNSKPAPVEVAQTASKAGNANNETETLVADVTPIAPKKYDPNATVLNLNVDYNQYPYLKEFNGIVWQYAGTDPANDPKNNSWLMKSKWTNLSLELADAATSTFNLKINSGNQSYEALVVPALSGKAFDKAMAKYQKSLQDYNTRQQQIAQQQALLQSQQYLAYQKHADIVRVFSVNKFGIYNCDRYRSDDGLFAVNWNVKLGEEGFDNSLMYIYHICKTDNTVTYCYPSSKTIKFDPNKENVLVAVLPNDKVAVFGRNDFEKMNLKGVKNGSDYTFRFSTLPQTMKTADDFSELVAGI